MSAKKTIPQRELRNNVSEVLREVAEGTQFHITVSGRPVADLIPARDRSPRTFASRAEVKSIVEQAPLDGGFSKDIDKVLGATIDEI